MLPWQVVTLTGVAILKLSCLYTHDTQPSETLQLKLNQHLLIPGMSTLKFKPQTKETKL